MIDLFVVLYVL